MSTLQKRTKQQTILQTAVKYRFTFAIALAICLFGGQGFASSLTALDQQIAALEMDVPRIREITHLVAQETNQPTKQIHDEFWGLLLTRIRADPLELQKQITEGANKGWPIQLAFWNSIRLSALSHRVIITKELSALRNDIPRAQMTADYISRQNAMLKAAATGQGYVFRSGESSLITEKTASATLANLHAAKIRLDRLFDPNW
jgi:hypothetical protein